MKSGKIVIPVLMMVFLLAAAAAPLMGQGETIITLRPPNWMGDVFDQEMFDRFTAEHPGTKIVLVRGDDQDMYYAPAAYELEDHLDGAEAYTSSADVLYVIGYNLSPEATRAGYFLDLSPLARSDANLDADDFFPAIWESFQWDNGIWAMPISASVQLVVYDTTAFDEAGLAYPDESWTLDDFIHAARELTQTDENGRIQVPGFEGYSPGLLFRSLLGQKFYDDTVIPYAPAFSSPELALLMETWTEFQKEMRIEGSYDYEAVPLRIEPPWRLTNLMPDSSQTWAAALLPNGTVGLDVQGFAVSAGTQNPELAYELAKFLTSDAEVVSRFFGNAPARRSMVGVEPEDMFIVPGQQSEEVQALVDRGLENAIPISDLMYSDYLNQAFMKMEQDGLDALTALQEVETQALEAQDTAASRRGEITVMVMTPMPTPSIAEHQIVLKFGLSLFTSGIPNEAEWKRLIEDFRAANPEVGNIDLLTQFFQQDDLKALDCYYQPGNSVADIDLSTILNLDPFMDADPSFDREDFLGNSLELVQRDGRTWAYPMVMQPAVLWYSPDRLADAGVPLPEGDWTIDAFKDALDLLQAASEDDAPVFTPQMFSNTYLLLLMGAYGGIPYDYRTTPPTYNLNDPAVIDAMRQVLDLAKAGYMDYQELANLSGGGGMMGNTPIYGDLLSTSSWQLQNRDNPDFPDQHLLTNYPRGSQYVPAAFDLGTAYITSNAQNPELCYRWLTTIAQRPDLLSGIPARRSLVDDPTVAIAQGEDITALYREFANKVDDPNALLFPGQYGGGSGIGSYIELFWLNSVFDNYVLHDADLEAELADAEVNIATYRECTASIPPYDPAVLDTPEAGVEYFRQYTDCAISVDPALKEQFSFYYQDEES